MAESIFQGWLESRNYRAEWNGSGTWSLYARQSNAFVYLAKVSGDRASTLDSLVVQLIKEEDQPNDQKKDSATPIDQISDGQTT